MIVNYTLYRESVCIPVKRKILLLTLLSFFLEWKPLIVVKAKGKNLTLVCTDDVSDMLLSKEIGTGDLFVYVMSN